MMAKRFSTPFAAAGAAVRAGSACSEVQPIAAWWGRGQYEEGKRSHAGRCESPCNPLTSGGPVSLPVVLPRLPFYCLRRGTPGAEAGDRLPVGAAQDQHVWV